MKKVAAVALTLSLCSSFLALPAELAAKGRRGALIILSKVDGTEVKGELVSVKPDSLLGPSPAVTAGTALGGLGLVIGMATSRGEKVESAIPFTGLTVQAADERWNALRARSREGRLKEPAKRPGPWAAR